MKKEKEKQAKKVRSTQNFLPILSISDGIVVTEDKRFVKIMEIVPTNFHMKSAFDKNSIISSFGNLLNVSPKKLQIKAITLKADTEKQLDLLYKEMAKETNPKCLEMQKDYEKLLKSVKANGGVSHRFFLIFEAEGIKFGSTIKEIKEELNFKEERLKVLLKDAGNDVIELDDKNSQIREILYTLLNRKKQESISDEKNVYDVVSKYMNFYEDERLLDIPLTEFIAPHSISFDSVTSSKIDGRFFSYLYIPSKGYNQDVYAGWLGTEINLMEGIDVDIFLTEGNQAEMQKKLRKIIQENRILLQEMSEANQGYEGMEGALGSAMYMRDGLRDGEKFFYLSILFTVSSDTEEELKKKTKILQEALLMQGMKARTLFAEQELGYLSTLPICKLDKLIENKSKRNVLTKGAASVYPFVSNEINDANGLFLGISRISGSMVTPDLFDRKKYVSSNLFICGKTGSGKTFLLQTIATRARLQHIPVYIIAVTKGHEFINLCENLGGQYIKFGPGTNSRINVLDIFPQDKSSDEMYFKDYKAQECSLLASKIQDLIVFFSLLIPDMTIEERQLIDEALINVYGEKGITTNNLSLVTETGVWRNVEMPILGDVVNELSKKEETRRIANISRQLVTGSAGSFNGKTNVNLNNPLTVLDLTPLEKSDNLLPPSMFMAIDFIMGKVKEDSSKKKFIMFDEWWKFTLNEYAAKYSMEIARLIRAYGGGVIFATQQLSDVNSANKMENYGKAVLNACPTKIILGLEIDEAEYVRDALRLTEREFKEILQEKQGNAMLVTNNNTLPIRIYVSELEKELFSTDRESKEAIILKRKRELEKASEEAEKRSVVLTLKNLEITGNEEEEWEV